MIISRTPLRISFFGGGTDYPDWYKENGGSVISATINKYNFINVRFLPPFFRYNNCIRYFIREETKNISEIKHPAIRETLKFLNFVAQKIFNLSSLIHSKSTESIASSLFELFLNIWKQIWSRNFLTF